tara:strand:+ start:3002 stop:3376 length:375 start_codon:yes stop_codon:yes gene_type:complete
MKLRNVLLSSIILLGLDAIYLTLTKNFFNNIVKQIQGTSINFKLLGAIICYFFLLFGINYFIINRNKSPYEAALLGLVIYGVYDATNYAIFNKWNLGALLIDTLWGGIVFYLTTFLTYKLNKIL